MTNGYVDACKFLEAKFDIFKLIGVIMELEKSEFKKEFWKWFDSLPKKEREKFQEYPADMAEKYFYNKIYSKKAQVSQL